ncbi:MAG: hypothetical protein WAP03_04080 [Methylorubrum rhodinum]|uniref:hypothetical protein n=1 Tax=Methylorubrum rhodinum TaxID=29428 RepID=UPI003BAF5050
MALKEIEGLALRWFEHAVQRVARTSRETTETRFIDWDAVLYELKAEGDVLTSPDPEDYEPAVHRTVDQCQTAWNVDPGSASKVDPLDGYGVTPLISPAERVGVAQPG